MRMIQAAADARGDPRPHLGADDHADREADDPRKARRHVAPGHVDARPGQGRQGQDEMRGGRRHVDREPQQVDHRGHVNDAAAHADEAGDDAHQETQAHRQRQVVGAEARAAGVGRKKGGAALPLGPRVPEEEP